MGKVHAGAGIGAVVCWRSREVRREGMRLQPLWMGRMAQWWEVGRLATGLLRRWMALLLVLVMLLLLLLMVLVLLLL